MIVFINFFKILWANERIWRIKWCQYFLKLEHKYTPILEKYAQIENSEILILKHINKYDANEI